MTVRETICFSRGFLFLTFKANAKIDAYTEGMFQAINGLSKSDPDSRPKSKAQQNSKDSDEVV